jgi:hypothetical protein
MADIKISDETLIGALANDDEIVIIDTSGGPIDRAVRIDQLRNFFTPRGYIFGLKLSNNGTDALNDIDVASGEAQAESHDEVMTLSSPITKRLDASWAVGNNQGGLNTGAEAANTWYEVHLIKRTDTGVVDVMFTTTANRTTLPTNYDKQRRIGWIRNDGSSNILAFTQVEDRFTLTTQINDVAATVTATATAVTLTVPPSTIARFRAAMANGTGGTNLNDQSIVFSEIVEGNVTPTITTGIASLSTSEPASAGLTSGAGHFELRVSATSQIEWDGSANGATGGGTFDISTFGWIDHRRRLDAI